jgi:hypothetical protein
MVNGEWEDDMGATHVTVTVRNPADGAATKPP